MAASSDRNLLFGILALQMDFVTREQLVAGMQAWVLEKAIPMAEHLVRCGALRPEHRQLLEPLVEAHIHQHGDDPQQSLASISSFDALRDDLAGIQDEQLDATIAHVPRMPSKLEGKLETASHSVGSASSQGTRFRILRPHAEGGLGRVFVAHDGELGREVALKEIKPDRADDPDSRSRFTREAEITGGLEHPGIVPVYGLGAYPDGRPFYAMRFIRGKSLKEAIEKFHERFTASRRPKPPCSSPPRKEFSPTEENLELRKLLQRLIDVCEAMDYAHSRGVLHRDLKPGNIMLGKYGETLVVDWGLAKPLGKPAASDPEQHPTDTTVDLSSPPENTLQPSSTSGSEPTILGSALGTPAFMSPEQAQGRLDLLGPASDVFSLGAILYQILTGQPLYFAPTKEEVLRKAQSGDYPTPRAIRRSISRPLESICLKALSPIYTDRYPTCKVFAQDLERYLADEPVTARCELFSERLFRLARRHRTAFLAAAAALGILVMGLLVGLLAVNHFRQVANKTAEANKNLADELTGKNAALEKKKQELNARVAANYFQHGVTEHQEGRAGKGIADLRRAMHYLPEDDPLRKSYLQILVDRAFQGGRILSLPMRHDAAVVAVAFSPDGTRLATASPDKTARIWDAKTGAPLGEPLRHNRGVNHVAFSPDGTRLATASLDETARIWDAKTGAHLGEPLRHGREVNHVAFSPDGTRLATASSDKTARIWDVKAGAPWGAPMQHEDKIVAVVFSPDGAKVATASDDKTARIWDAKNGMPVGQPLRHDSAVWNVAFSPDGTKVATACISLENTARIWNTQTGQPVGEPLRHDAQVLSVAFSPDGTRLATASNDRTARLWNAQTGEPLGESLSHGAAVFRVTFSPDGARLATASWDTTARIWNAKTGMPLGEPLQHDSRVFDVTFSPDGATLATACDKTARIWDVQKGMPAVEPLRHYHELPEGVADLPDELARLPRLSSLVPNIANLTSVAFTPDGLTLATAGQDKTAQIWDLRNGRHIGEPLHHEEVVLHVTFGPGGTRLATASRDTTARIWNAKTGAPVGDPLRHDGGVNCVAFSPDGAKVATASDDKTARIWNAQSGALLRTLHHDETVNRICFSPDNASVATASDDKTARVWNVKTGTLMRELHHDETINHAVFSLDGTRLVTASQDNTARIWDAQNGMPVGELLRHESWVNHVAFSPDGTRLVTASQDKTARIWNAQTGMPVGEPLRHDGNVNQADFIADGASVATASDGTVRIWDAQTGLPLGKTLRHDGVVNGLAFSPDGTRLATANADGTARVWFVLQELRPSTSELKTWCAVMTGQQIDENGNLEDLTQKEWLVERKKLDGMKAWQDYLAEGQRRRERLQLIEVEEAEFNEQWFSAAFHLRWALKKEPGSEELKQRLAAAEQKLKEEQEEAKKAIPNLEPGIP